MIRAIARTYRAAFHGLPRDVWLLSLVALVNRAGTMVLPFFALFLTRDRGFSVIESGQLLAVYGLGSAAGSYLGGWLSDHIGANRTAQLSLMTSGIGFLVLPFLHGTIPIAVAMFLLATIAESFRPAAMTATAHRAPVEVRARSFALLRLAVNLGMAVGPAVGGVLALYSYTWLFVVDALTCWAAGILLALTLGHGRVATEEGDGRPDVETRSPWTDGPFLALMGLVVLLAAVLFQIFSTLPLYLNRAYGLMEDRIGQLLALNALLIVVFEMVLIHWAERHDRMLLTGIGAFLFCGGLALMPWGSTMGFAALTVSIWTVGEMLTLPLINAAVADRPAPPMRGRYMGVYMLAFSIAFVFGPVVGTWIYETFGPERLWYGIGVVGVVLLVGHLALIRPFRSGNHGVDGAARES